MMVKLVQEIGAGTWKPSHVRGDLKDGTVVLDPSARPCRPRQEEIDEAKAQILSGARVVWKGPSSGRTGKTLVAAGSPAPCRRSRPWATSSKGVIGTVK